ncbi:MAG: glycosyltransferase [Desulfocapsaceae bacterium]|nr:glycosyltransferase [Desulfocapsaceae bacterium]
MKIGIVTTWFERGAAYVSRQYMKLLERNNNVFIYARGGEKYAKNNKEWNLPNVTWGEKALFQTNGTPINKLDFSRWIKSKKIDIVLFNEQQWWPPIIWAKELGVIVGSYIDYYTEETVPLFEVFDFLICNTERHFSVFDWHKQCFYVPWGTDVELFKPRRKREIDKDKVVFFNSSGYNPERKGVYPLLKAFYSLKEDNKKLILHSQVDLRKYYKDIAFMVDELQGNGQLEIINETVGAPGLYHLADVYCYISKLDGIGLTLPEAISCGLQAIVPDNAPMNEFVKEGVNGQLVKVDRFFRRKDAYYWPNCDVNIDDLIKKMSFYLENYDKIEQLKETSRKYAREKLNWSDRSNLIDEIFNNIEKTAINCKLQKTIYSYELSRRTLKDIMLYPYFLFKTLKR